MAYRNLHTVVAWLASVAEDTVELRFTVASERERQTRLNYYRQHAASAFGQFAEPAKTQYPDSFTLFIMEPARNRKLTFYVDVNATQTADS